MECYLTSATYQKKKGGMKGFTVVLLSFPFWKNDVFLDLRFRKLKKLKMQHRINKQSYIIIFSTFQTNRIMPCTQTLQCHRPHHPISTPNMQSQLAVEAGMAPVGFGSKMCLFACVWQAGIIIGIAMIGLGFEEDQENSLDILIKFQDEHQQPESHTHEELYLPLPQSSVTSHPTSPALHGQQLPARHHQLAQELLEKMRAACDEQELKMLQILGRKHMQKQSAVDSKARNRRGEQPQQEEHIPHSKRKIIRKKSTG